MAPLPPHHLTSANILFRESSTFSKILCRYTFSRNYTSNAANADNRLTATTLGFNSITIEIRIASKVATVVLSTYFQICSDTTEHQPLMPAKLHVYSHACQSAEFRPDRPATTATATAAGNVLHRRYWSPDNPTRHHRRAATAEPTLICQMYVAFVCVMVHADHIRANVQKQLVYNTRSGSIYDDRSLLPCMAHSIHVLVCWCVETVMMTTAATNAISTYECERECLCVSVFTA